MPDCMIPFVRNRNSFSNDYPLLIDSLKSLKPKSFTIHGLLVGYYGSKRLLFAGRVGTGFSERALTTLYEGLQKIRRASCLFVNLPEKKPGRWGLRITPAVMKRCHWVEPLLVAQVKFTEWTSDDQLQQPVFLGLRSDKDQRTWFANSLHVHRILTRQGQ
jgi:ATP-dependent DNA ligase